MVSYRTGLRYLNMAIILVIAVYLSLITIWLLEHPIKYVFYILEIALILALYKVLRGADFRVEIKLRSVIWVMPDIALILFSSFSLLFLIGISNVLQPIIALLLASFLPGCALLNLANLSRSFSKMEQLVFSYVLSYSITASLTFAFMFLGKAEELPFLIVIAYLVIGIFSIIKHIRRITHLQTADNLTLKKVSFSASMDLVVLIVVFSFFSVAVSSLFPDFSLLPGTDIARHYMWARTLIRSPELYSRYVYLWFHLFLACIYQLSGASFVILQTTLMILNFMPILAFYIMAKKYLGKTDKRLPILSTTFWALFSGLAWMEFAHLKLSSGLSQLALLLHVAGRTYNGTIYATGLGITGHTPFVVSFTIFFTLLYLMRRTDLKRLTYFLLFSFLFVSCYLTHISEAVVLSLFVAVYVLLGSKEKTTKETLLSILFGFALVGLVYIGLTFLINFVYSHAIIVPLLVPPALVGSSYLLLRKRKFLFVSKRRFKHVALPMFLTLLLLFALSLLVWISMSDSFHMAYVDEVGLVPWFFYAFIIGITGLLATVGLYYYLSNPEKYSTLKLFILLGLCAFLVGRVVSFINAEFFYIGSYEKRFIYFIAVASALFASVGLTKLVPPVRARSLTISDSSLSYSLNTNLRASTKPIKGYLRMVRKNLVACFVVSLVVVCGVSSTLLCIETWTYVTKNTSLTPTAEELNALHFLDKTFDSNTKSFVVTVTPESYDMLTFTAPQYRLYKNWVLCNTTSPDFALYMLSSEYWDHMFSQAYLYLHNRDMHDLDSKYNTSYLFRHLLPSLHMIFNNSEVSIYEIPKLSSPLPDSTVALVLPTDQHLPNGYLYSYDALALGQYSYTVMYESDDKIWQKAVIVLPFDPSEDSVTSQLSVHPKDYLEYVRSGGQLIVLNTNGSQFFGDTLLTKSNRTFFSQKIIGDGEIEIPEIEVTMVNVTDGVEMLSYYVTSSDEKIALSAHKTINNGRLVYVNIHPLVQALTENSFVEKSKIYEVLGRVLGVASLDIPNSTKNESPTINPQITFKNVELKGAITASTDAIFLPNPLNLDILNITIGDETLVLTSVNSIIFSDYAKATITMERAEIANGNGLYARMTASGMAKIEITGDEITIEANASTGKVMLNGTSAEISFFDNNTIDIYAREPHIQVEGTSFFNEMYIEDVMLQWLLRAYGHDLGVNGSTRFTMYYSDIYSIAGEISITGSVSRDPPIVTWNEWSSVPSLVFWVLIMLPVFIFAIILVYRHDFSSSRKRLITEKLILKT